MVVRQDLRWRNHKRNTFLASPSEALALPDGVDCIVTGVVAYDEGLGLLDDDSIVWAELLCQPEKGSSSAETMHWGRSFFLEDKNGGRVLVDASSLSTFNIVGVDAFDSGAEGQAVGWAVCRGDGLSVTGQLQDLPDGTRVLTGKETYLCYPMEAYGDDPLWGLRRATSADQIKEVVGSGNSGPALLKIKRGTLTRVPSQR